MANITNRSPWQVKLLAGIQKFRLKSQAVSHLTSLGYDPEKLPTRVLKQLETAFEVQITRKDSKGEKAKRHQTFDTRELAEAWGKDQEKQLEDIVKAQGGFTVGFETVTVEEVLERLLEQHYKKKASYNEISYRIPRVTEWLGPKRKFRELTRLDMTNLLARLQAVPYSHSSINNFFTILTTLYRFAKKRWHYPVENIASGMDLEKPDNAIQRYWVGDEEDRLMKSLELRSPWLMPIVQLSLEMAFRRGELVQAPVRKPKIRGAALAQPSTVVAAETNPKSKLKL